MDKLIKCATCGHVADASVRNFYEDMHSCIEVKNANQSRAAAELKNVIKLLSESRRWVASIECEWGGSTRQYARKAAFQD